MLRIFILKNPKTKNKTSAHMDSMYLWTTKNIIVAKEIISYSTLLSNYKAIIYT